MDSYIYSVDEKALKDFCRRFGNIVGPCRGRSAQNECVDDTGNVIPSEEAVGDPLYWYALVRSDVPLDLALEIEPCDPVIGRRLLGEWA